MAENESRKGGLIAAGAVIGVGLGMVGDYFAR
jgi:hypothetical protein